MKMKLLTLGGLLISLSAPAFAWDMSLGALSSGLESGRYTQGEIDILVNRCLTDPDCNFVPIAPPNDDDTKFQQAVHQAKMEAMRRQAVKKAQPIKRWQPEPPKAKSLATIPNGKK